MGLLSSIGASLAHNVGSIVGSAGSLVGSILNYNLGRRQLSYQKSVDSQNFENQERQFQYQKYLNNNQIQIQSADALKAGINPMAMNSSSLSSANYSNVNSNSQSPQFDLGSLLQAGIAMDENKKARAISDAQISSQEAMQAKKIASDEYIAQLNADTQRRIAMMNNNQSGINAETSASASRYGSDMSYKGTKYTSDSVSQTALNRLIEDKYQFDKNFEVIQAKFNNQTKQESLHQLQDAWDTYNNLVYHGAVSSSKGGNIVSSAWNILSGIVRTGREGLSDWKKKHTDPNYLSEDDKFVLWYLDSGYQIPTRYDSSVRRRD